MTDSNALPFLAFEIDGKKSAYRILLVEDAESIQLAIRDFLFARYDVTVCSNAEEALMLLADSPEFDLLLADIRLPEMNGLELARLARKVRPEIRIVLITSYDVNEFIDVIREQGFSQVITKHGRMSLKEIEVTIEKVLSNDIFGIQKYFPQMRLKEVGISKFPRPLINGLLYSVVIRSLHERIEVTDAIADQLKAQKKMTEALSKLVLDELASNAMFRAPVNEAGEYKYQNKNAQEDILEPHQDIVLDEEDWFTIQFGLCDDWVIIACIDPHGRLSQKEILYRLHRHLSLNQETGMPEGLHDSHGRGLFLLREQLSSIVFNLARGRSTEVICFHNTIAAQAYKNISIYEIEAPQ